MVNEQVLMSLIELGFTILLFIEYQQVRFLGFYLHQ